MSDEQEWHNLKSYTSDTAVELAALTSIQRDLQFAARACELLLGRLPESTTARETDQYAEEVVIRTSLWNAALIAYARAFASGVRGTRLSVTMFDSLGEKSGRAVTFHEYFLAQRSKHIAHSVNRLEEVRVALAVDRGPDGASRVRGAGPFHVWRAEEERSNVEALLALANFLAQAVNSQVTQKLQEVLAEAQRLDPRVLSELPDAAIQVPVEAAEVLKRRT